MPPSRNFIGYYRERCLPPLTQAELARTLQVHVNTVQNWERHGVASAASLLKLATLLVKAGALTDRAAIQAFWNSGGRDNAKPFPLPPELDEMLRHGRSRLLPVQSSLITATLPPGSRMPLHPNALFVDRLADLHALATEVQLHRAVIIHGIGGVGKTQLAAEFVHRYGHFFVGGVFWVSCANPAAVPLEVAICGGTGFMELRPDFEQKPLDQQVRLVQAAWQQSVPRLLVFDNCEDEALLARWLPTTGGCRAVVTGRNARWSAALGGFTHTLGPFQRDQSITLLGLHRPELLASEELDLIAAELGDLPLALHLAGSFLARYHSVVTPRAYLDQLANVSLLHPSLRSAAWSPTGHHQHLAHTFALGYNQLRANDVVDAQALQLLARAALFAPGEPLPQRILFATLPDFATVPSQRDGVYGWNRLLELGLIEERRSAANPNPFMHMHRLICAFVRMVADDATAHGDVERCMLAELTQVIETGHPARLNELQSHAQHIVDSAAVRADAQAAQLCGAFGRYLSLICDYPRAHKYVTHAHAITAALFGPRDPRTAASVNALALQYQFEGNYPQALAYYHQALEMRQQHDGHSHPETALVQDNLGYQYLVVGDYERAHAHLRAALSARLHMFGEHHSDTAYSLNGLGYLRYLQGVYDEGQHYLERALAVRKAVLGEHHPATAQSYNNLGDARAAQGDHESAQRLHEQALRIREQVFGTQHPDVAESLRNIASIFLTRCNYSEAQAVAERALAICEDTLGVDHLDTAWCYKMLGDVYLAQHEKVIATNYFQRALAVYDATLEPGHRDIREVRFQLSKIV